MFAWAVMETSVEIRNTRERAEVLKIYQWSIAQVAIGLVGEVQNWDRGSTWHNSLFRDLETGKQWAVYLADQAWPGEVRLVIHVDDQEREDFASHAPSR